VIATEVDLTLPADNVDVFKRGVFQFIIPLTALGSGSSIAHSLTRIYADPGSGVGVQVSGTFAGSNGASCVMYLTGHLETK
jgi:hypothetical protein